MEYMEQLFISTQVQIRNRIWTKIPGNKTTFEFGPNLLGVQTGLEKSDKFPKFLICPALQIMNLDCHGCMAKTEVSILALLGLGLNENEKSVSIWIQLNQAHMPLIPSNYKMKHYRLHITGYSEN